MHVFLSYVLSLICEAVLYLELIFVELGQAHYKKKKIIFIIMEFACRCCFESLWAVCNCV